MSLRGIVAKSQEMHSTKKMQNNTALLTHCPTPIIFLYFNSKRFVPIHVGNAVLEGLIYTMVLQVPSLIQDKALENELQARMRVPSTPNASRGFHEINNVYPSGTAVHAL